MAGSRQRPSISKRQKERQRAEKKARKEAKRRERKDEEEGGENPQTDGIDPDIAGIVPGPQPLPSEYGLDNDDDEEEAKDEGAADSKAS